jgi:TonB-dependent starch-binding outer membrane protein SusC
MIKSYAPLRLSMITLSMIVSWQLLAQSTKVNGMVRDTTSLDERVVTGYGSERKADLVSSVSQVSAEHTVAIPVSTLEQALQGRVAGVLTQTSGQPGALGQIRIRGFGSFFGNAPLFIVDGVPTDDVSNLNPYDIESTTVLKDAGAAAIYGSRALAGVIVYTTKHGKYDGKTRMDFDVSTGLNVPGSGITMLNPTQQAQKVYEALRNGGGSTSGQPYGPDINNPVIPDFINVGGAGNVFNGDPRVATAIANYNVDAKNGQIIQVVAANKAGTDWYKEMTRVAPIRRYSLGISSGSDRAHYYFGLSYYDQQGIVINQYLTRYNLRLNSEFKPTKNLRIGQNFQLANVQNPRIGDAQSENELNQAYRMPTVIPVKDVRGGWAGTAAPGLSGSINPVASRTRSSPDYNASHNTNLFGNVHIEYDPIKNLTLRSSLGGRLNYYYFNIYNPGTYENLENVFIGTLNEGAGYATQLILTNTVRYEKKFGNHTLRGLVGHENIQDPGASRMIFGYGSNPFSNDPDFINLSTTDPASRQVGSSIIKQLTLTSYFFRFDYSKSSKYYLSATLRRDGFSLNDGESSYRSVSSAWRISSERFMKEITWINDLKLRGSWGGLSSTYNTDATLSTIGLDGTFMNGTLEVTVELWQKNTDKILFRSNNSTFVDVGSMVNKGIDLQISKRIKVNNDWGIVLNGNISSLQNKITDLGPGGSFGGRTFRGLNFVRNEVGQPISSFFGYQMVGYFQDANEVATSATQPGAAPGRFKFNDAKRDGIITPDDRVHLGSPVPTFTYGLNVTAKYKSWSLDAFFYGKSGHQIINFSKWYNGFYQSFSGAGLAAITLDAWTPEKGNNAKAPILETASTFSTNASANSWYMENGSYLRLKNLQLNYNVPSSFLHHSIRSLRLYLQAVNLFTITKYTGLDPEVASTTDSVMGVDVGNYPATQIWSVGLHLGF